MSHDYNAGQVFVVFALLLSILFSIKHLVNIIITRDKEDIMIQLVVKHQTK